MSFVGREKELELLRSAWQRALDGQPQIAASALITIEPAKTRVTLLPLQLRVI